MSQRVQLTGTISAVPSGQVVGGIRDEFILDLPGCGDTFDDVRQRSYLLSTGTLGQSFALMDTPSTVMQLAIVSRVGAELIARLNGAAANLLGSSAAFGTIVNGDTFTINVDQAGAIVVTFLTGDITLPLVCQRINAAVGSIVAYVDTSGQLRLIGAKTGNQEASLSGRQYGSIVLSGAALAKLGLVAGTTFGAGRDIPFAKRFVLEPPVSGTNIVTRVELSGSGEVATHFAGR